MANITTDKDLITNIHPNEYENIVGRLCWLSYSHWVIICLIHHKVYIELSEMEIKEIIEYIYFK